jgi:hypothetical protein
MMPGTLHCCKDLQDWINTGSYLLELRVFLEGEEESLLGIGSLELGKDVFFQLKRQLHPFSISLRPHILTLGASRLKDTREE